MTNSPVFFGKVEVDSPLNADENLKIVEMIQLQGIDRFYMSAFNASFVFRPFLKIIAFASCAVIALVLLIVGVRAAVAIPDAPENTSVPLPLCPKPGIIFLLVKLAFFLCLLSFCVLSVTGFGPLLLGERLQGYLLMLHVTFAPVFIAAAAGIAVFADHRSMFSQKNPFSKVIFWGLLMLSLPVTLTMALCMLPVFGSHGQEALLVAHRWFALLFAFILFIEFCLLIYIKSLKNKKDGPNK